MVRVDGSVLQIFNCINQHSLQGFNDFRRKPTATAWKSVGYYAAYVATHKLRLPGKGSRVQ
ncbi:Hypothetical predicted protein [Olea europaea subsp. europaea]|uniref:Uncharacterized protein n=2 Tax=Olea europaea subsp. europaea TaxID=158383 RepID=A0A8S0SDD8_OLEEU|nr:Hypothetical predicted protein [Olea europaea subsp. europaea]